MDDRKAYSRAGIPYRLTGKGGIAVWVVPQATRYDHPGVPTAQFANYTKKAELYMLNDAEVAAAELDASLPVPSAPADPGDVQRLHSYVSAPTSCTKSATTTVIELPSACT